MRKFLHLITILFFFQQVSAQDFSNKGREFWLVFPAHVQSSQQGRMALFITSDKNSSGTIEVNNFSTTFTVNANGVSGPIDIPYSNANVGTNNVVMNRGIHVKVNAGQPPVVLFAHIYAGFRSEASLILPVSTLGKKYYSTNFWQRSTGNSKSQFNIVATEANTVVQYQLRVNGVLDPTPVTVSLPSPGDQIQVQNDNDLSGSIIESVASGTGSCKKIAVFSGSSAVAISSSTCTGSSYDPLFQQCYPTTTWGKTFGIVPFLNNPSGFHVRVMASENNTTVNFDGTNITLNAGEYYPATTANPSTFKNPMTVSADKPISMSQYMMSGACTGSINLPGQTEVQGDPDMIILNPVEQNIRDINIFSSNLQNIRTKYLSVYMRTSQAASFRINNQPPAGTFIPMPQNNGFSYLQEDLSNYLTTAFRLTADSGFNAMTYGMGDAESYAYSAGTNVKDLYQQIGTASQYGIETVPSVCINSGFKFKISLPYQPDSMYWDLSPVHAPVWVKRVGAAPLPFDSIRTINGKQVWWYSLPLTYVYPTAGLYTIRLNIYNPSVDGCGNVQENEFDLEVSDPPTSQFTWVAPRCVGETVQFTDATTTSKPVYKWWWDFDDPGSGAANNTSAVKDPSHKFSTSGTYVVRYANTTTPGCLSDTAENTIVVAPMPSATIASTVTSVCRNGTAPTITLTGSGGAPAPYTFSYTINGVLPALTATTTAGNSTTISVPTNTTGPVRYALTNVQNTNAPLCVSTQTAFRDIIIRPLPLAAATGTTSVCQNGPAPTVTFTGSGATAPYKFTYNINGGAPQTISTTAGNSVTITVPTAVSGVFAYNITDVSDGTSDACSQSITTPAATVTVLPLPTGTLTGSATTCQNSPSPNLTFTGANGTAPYTFTYKINNGPDNTVTTVSGNSVTVPITTAAVGTQVFTLIRVRDAGANICTQAIINQSATIVVNPLPTATISGTTSVCQNAVSPAITFTGANATAPYTFTYTVNGGTPQTVTTVSGNSVTLPVPTNTAIPLVYDLIKVTDASPAACARTITGASATVTVRPLPTATISGTTAVCQNAVSPTITFTGATGTAPYTFTYNINGALPNLTISTTGANNSVTVPVPTGSTGPLVYNLVNVTDASSNTCSRVITGQSATVTVKTLPAATISTVTSEVCLGTSGTAQPRISFTGANGTAPYRFTYRLNGSPTDLFATTTAGSNTVTVVVPTTTAGTFTYYLVAVSESSPTLCSQPAIGLASVKVNPLPTASFVATAPTCQTRTISFNSAASAANAGTIATYQWNFGDPSGGTASNTSGAANPTHVYSATGTYQVSLTIITDKGCRATIQTPVTINPRPKAGFAVPEVCVLDPYAEFTDTSKVAAPGTITGWEWDFGDAANSTPGNPNTSTQQNARHKYSVIGTYTVRLIAISNTGCRDTTTNPIVINDGNVVSDFQVASNVTYCGNDTVRIINKSTVSAGTITRLEIVWDNVNAPTLVETDQTPSFDKLYKHKYPEFQSPLTKQYSIRVRAYSGGACFSDKVRIITLNATPNVVFAALPNGCIDVPPYRITQASETGGVPGTGVYSGPGVIPAGAGVYNFSPAIAGQGSHTIKYTYTSAAGCIDSVSATVTVYPNPVVDAGPDVTILAGGSTTLQPTVTGNDLRYLWTENKYLNNNTLKNPLASPPEDFSYTLTVTGRGGCTSSDILQVKVLMAPKIPNTFTPNNDGKNDFWRIEYLDTYPNCKVQIFTRTGAQVFESKGYKRPWNGTMNGASLPADTYYYIIEPESGRKPITGYVTVVK